MTPEQQTLLLNQAKDWFRNSFMEKHAKNARKLSKLSNFKVNPFLLPYLAHFFDGSLTPEAKAKVLLLPRILGTSVNTTFGTQIQVFTSQVLRGVVGSTTSGIDIEFEDAITREKTYCQVKLGPNTINKDDVKTIDDHFQAAKRLARTNRAQRVNFMVGVLYGSATDLSNHYKALRDVHQYDVFVGEEFWHRLTGSETFYAQLQAAFAEVAISAHGKELIESVVKRLAAQITEQEL
jgi:Type II restriction endonuclease EcoO109I